jgi:hypothetical protein
MGSLNGSSISKQWADLRAMWFLMATRGPAGALLKEIGMVDIANEDVARDFLLLEMAL